MGRKVLVVDDEKLIVKGIRFSLEQEGMEVEVAYDGEEAVEKAKAGEFDIVLLDIMLPGLSGEEVLPKIKGIPVIIVSAKVDVDNKVDLLLGGAADYITKPFHTNELLARIKALLRRKQTFTGDVLTFNDISLDRNTFELVKGEKRILLGKKEFQILEMLMLNKGNSIDKERFIEKIWGFDTNAEYNTVEVYVSFLRKKLLAVNSNTEIKSLRGIGYTLGVNK